MDWNADAVDQLRTLCAEGHSFSQIARIMGCSKNAAVSKAHRINLPPRKSPIKPRGSGIRPNKIKRASRITIEALSGEKPMVAQESEAVSARITVGVDGCQWPIGEPRTPGFRFCGREIKIKSYCEVCAELAFVRRAEPVLNEHSMFSFGRRVV